MKTSVTAGTLGARIIFCLGSIVMASGIAAAAAAAHAGAGPELGTASTILLSNAPMLAASGVALALGLLRKSVGLAGIMVGLIGAGLFSADMVHRGFGHGALFPDAAPIGGSMDILGWLVVAIATILPPHKTGITTS